MRAALSEYMAMRPLPRAAMHERVASWGQWFLTPKPAALSLIAVLFISSTGVSFAAESALPGDVLYGIKVGINEPIRGALAVSNAAHAEWAMQVAGERVKEVAALAADGRLTAATEDEARQSFEAHADIALASITKQTMSSADVGAETALKLEARLAEYGRVLSEVGSAKGVDVSSLASAVEERQSLAASERDRAQTLAFADDGPHVAVAASRMGEAAESGLSKSTKLAARAGISLDASSASIVSEQLTSAGNTIQNGKKLLAENAAPQAFDAFRSALSAAEQLGAYLETTSAIHARTGLVVGEPDGGAMRTLKATSTPEEGTPSSAAPTPATAAATSDERSGFSATQSFTATTDSDASGSESEVHATIQSTLNISPPGLH